MINTNTQGILPIAGQDNPNKLLDVLFIHGLGGDAFSTWQLNDDEKYFWPKVLNKDFPDTAIWTIGYGATATSWIEDVMPMEDRVENLLNQLTLKNIGQKPFFLITHSMGGLIAKYLLTQAAQSNDKKYQQFATQCAGIVFLAVPHNGSGWSNLLDYARVLVRGNKIVAQIAKDDPALRQLDKNFGQFCERQVIDCYGFYETKEVRLKKKLFGKIPWLSKGIKVVSESSASSTFLTTTAVPMDDDHLSICKISSKEDLLYLNIIDILKDLLSRIRTPKNIDKDKQPDKPEETETAKENPKPPPIKEEDKTLFLLFHLKQQDNKIISINENAHENITPIDALLPFNNTSAQKQAMATALFGDQNINEKNDKTKIRIRIMTDDPQLAMLPWHCLETKQFTNQQTTIEISPITLTHHSSFISYSPNNPLCVIPANPSDGISSDSHFRIIEENFKSYFDIKHNITRVFTASQLQREIEFLNPDIIYIYARYENETILLDIDTLSKEPLTLNQLAQWLNDNDLKPLIILSLIGDKISDYPKSLVENSHLLWIQQTRSKLQANTNLSNNIAHVFNLSNQNPDIIHAIQKIDPSLSHEISHHHWIKGRSIKIDMTDPEQSGERQLRAALLRIMLGRESIKNALHGQIFHSDIINNSSFLSYVVTGDKSACPFDFPAQLQQRLQYDDMNHSLKVIPFYFNIVVKPEYDTYFNTIENALSQGILHESNNIAEIFHKAVSKYDECCISLNWLLKVSQENQHLLKEWLIEWRGIQCHWFANKVPDQTVLLNAVCIQIEQADNNQALAQEIQELANEILEETESCQMQAIYIEDALGTLKVQEIKSFLSKNPYWQKQLKLDQNNIDLKDYTNWVYKQEKGKFDPSVRIIWQQSQDNYQKYLESS